MTPATLFAFRALSLVFLLAGIVLVSIGSAKHRDGPFVVGCVLTSIGAASLILLGN